MSRTFRAFVVNETGNKEMVREIRERAINDLPSGDVLVRVHYSSLNFKDALSATGNRAVTTTYPHTPGIDAAGVVAESGSPAFRAGDKVICTGFDLGMNTAGGFGQYIRVPADWLVRLPEGLSLRESMIYGTAGFTAALCVNRLQQEGVTPEHGEIVVTGATGGVGSLAVAVLARLGYRVIAVTGKSDGKPFLERLGAAEVVSREAVDDKSGKPLLPMRWAGAVDTVGGNILATILKCTRRYGIVTCCGLVGGIELPTSVLPFILRNVTLVGIDSVLLPSSSRPSLWAKLAADWKPTTLDDIANVRSLDQLDAEIDRILHGGQVGRVVVELG